ncbi:MAG: hypothetical protein MHPSP_001573, partial [Paramarteilia canceri]
KIWVHLYEKRQISIKRESHMNTSYTLIITMQSHDEDRAVSYLLILIPLKTIFD